MAIPITFIIDGQTRKVTVDDGTRQRRGWGGTKAPTGPDVELLAAQLLWDALMSKQYALLSPRPS